MQDCSTSVTSDDASEWAILSSLQAANVGYWKVVNSPVSKQQVSKLTDFSPNITKQLPFLEFCSTYSYGVEVPLLL